jgi:hypothetical protein
LNIEGKGMAKEYYQVSYKTYLNERVKPVLFRDRETFPLYVQVTYDRKTTSLKSYYFDVFAQPMYDYLGTTLAQMDELESRAIDYVTVKYADRFYLSEFPTWYKLFNRDVLDGLERPFKEWLISYFEGERAPGYAALLRMGMQTVCALELLDEFKIALAPDLYERLMAKAAKDAPPYIPMAEYIRNRQPKGPFCLPVHEWIQHETQVDAEEYIYNEFYAYEMGRILKEIKLLLYPRGF